MTKELLDQLNTQGGCVDLSSRAKFRLTGADRVRYLNGQVTNDVRRLSADESMYACVTDAKGRIAGDVFIHAEGDSLLIDAEAALREALAMRLERYIVADDVTLEDVTEDHRLVHVFGSPGHGVKCVRLGLPGADLWASRKHADVAFSGEPLSSDDLEAYRILQGIPRWPNELGGDVFPQEAGLEARAMSFTKGCYIGQEILSRIKSTGKMPRELVQWRARDAEAAVEAGDELSLDGRVVGKITSVTHHPALGVACGLAFVKQGGVAKDSILLASKGAPSIEAAIEISAFVK